MRSAIKKLGLNILRVILRRVSHILETLVARFRCDESTKKIQDWMSHVDFQGGSIRQIYIYIWTMHSPHGKIYPIIRLSSRTLTTEEGTSRRSTIDKQSRGCLEAPLVQSCKGEKWLNHYECEASSYQYKCVGTEKFFLHVQYIYVYIYIYTHTYS